MKLILTVILALIFLPQTAFAHAEMLSSNPAAGTTFDSVPQEMTFTFNEPIGTGSKVALIDAQFRRTELPSRVDGAVLVVEMPTELESGTYSVEFDAVSADGHTVLGSVQFQIVADSGKMPVVLMVTAAVISIVAIALLVKRSL